MSTPAFGVRLHELLQEVRFPGLTLDFQQEANRWHLRVQAPADSPMAVCNTSGLGTAWNGRWWRLSPFMTDGEIVQTAFTAVLTALEHEARERFTFMGQAVFDPHYDIYKLVELRSQADALKERHGGQQ